MKKIHGGRAPKHLEGFTRLGINSIACCAHAPLHLCFIRRVVHVVLAQNLRAWDVTALQDTFVVGYQRLLYYTYALAE